MCPSWLSEQAFKIHSIALSLLQDVAFRLILFVGCLFHLQRRHLWQTRKKGKRLTSSTFLGQPVQAGEHALCPTILQNSDQSICLSDLRYEDLAVITASKISSPPRNTSSVSFADGRVVQLRMLDFAKSRILECVCESESQHPRIVSEKHW